METEPVAESRVILAAKFLERLLTSAASLDGRGGRATCVGIIVSERREDEGRGV